MRQAGVAALQKSDGRRDGCPVYLKVIREEARRCSVLLAWQRSNLSMNGFESLNRQQFQCQADGQIHLFCVKTA